MMKLRYLAVAALFLVAAAAQAADLTAGMKKGTPEIKTAGPLAFGPDGILFAADSGTSTLFAIATGDTSAPKDAKQRPTVENIDEKIAALLGVDVKQARIADVAVNPKSGNTYLSVARGQGGDAKAVILVVDRAGKITEFKTSDVMFSSVKLEKAATTPEAVTDIAFVKDRVFVAGLSTEEFKSKLRAYPFPFAEGVGTTSVEIFHGAHGKFETAAPVRTFVAYDIGGETNLLAAYTCTPLVKFPVKDIKAGEKVKGTTVAELGNMNRPLDMIVYKKGGKDYLLLANSARGIMKINLEGIDKIDAITKPVTGGGVAGLKYDKIENLKGVEQLDKFDDEHAILLSRKDGKLVLETIELP